MSGSKRYFKYITDSGAAHSVYLDESNSEAIIGEETRLMPDRDLNFPRLPVGIKMRYLRAISQDAYARERVFYVGDPDIIRNNPDAATITAPVYPGNPPVQWVITCYRGEKQSYAPPINTTGGDTGLNDGDQGRDEGG